MVFITNLFLVVLGVLHRSQGLKIDLFTERNYVGTIPFGTFFNGWDESPAACFNFPRAVSKTLSSIKTNGHCVILFSKNLCVGNSTKLEHDVPNLAALFGNVTHDNVDDMAMSLKACSATEGGPEVKVDFYSEPDYKGSAQSSDKLCRCKELPADQTNVSSIDNHHHCIELYSSVGCNTNDKLIQIIHPGKSSVSGNLTNLPIYQQIRSYRPCRAPPECMKLDAKIYSFKIVETNCDDVKPQPLDMAGDAKFFNNGSAIVTQQYTAKTKLKEVIEIGKIEMENRITSWSTASTVTIGASLATGDTSVKASVGLKAAYGGSCEQGKIESEKYITEENSEFTTTQTIEIAPCSFYDVTATLKVIENYPLEYIAYFKISGEYDGKQLTSEDLQDEVEHMPSYAFDHVVDDYTIAVYTSSYILMSFGAEAEIIGNGGKIPNCYW